MRDDMTEGQQDLHLQHMAAVGHICFFCHRRLQIDDMITAGNAGPLPIYFHTACGFPEEVVEQMYAEAIERFKEAK